MIEFKRVTKRYANGHVALNNVDFTLARGEFAFLTGHSGAGKSTLLKLIAAIESPSEGSIRVDKQEIHQLRPREVPFLRRQIGIILQNPELLMDRTVFENVSLPLIIAGHSYKDIRSRVRAALSKVSLTNKEKYFPFELSTGEQQRVAIARGIIHKPPVLLADEPTGNLDPELASNMMTLFEQFNQLGMTVLIASHDLALISQLKLKHRMLKLAGGKLCEA